MVRKKKLHTKSTINPQILDLEGDLMCLKLLNFHKEN